MVSKAQQRPWADVKAEEMREHPEVYAAYEAFKVMALVGGRVDPDRPLLIVERPADVPLFASEAEEHEYWGTHEMGDAWFDTGTQIPADQRPPVRVRREPGGTYSSPGSDRAPSPENTAGYPDEHRRNRDRPR